MPKKTFTTEQIISKLREAEVLVSQGQTVPAACKVIGVSEQTYYRWRKSYGGLKIDQAQRLRELEQ
jgi:putative transposase